MSLSSAKDANGSGNREAKGFLVLIAALAVPFLLQYGYRYFFYKESKVPIEITYIPEECEPEKSFRSYPDKHRTSFVYTRPAAKQQQIVNINTADSVALEKLPGIGFKLASRIIKYRSLLGGYVQLEQLKEVYGLPEETYEQIKPFCSISVSDVKKIFADSLWIKPYKIYHPYLSKELKAEITAAKKKESFNSELLKGLIQKSNERLGWYVLY